MKPRYYLHLTVAGMWLCVYNDTIWEAWAWEGQSKPPSEFKASGYRWVHVATLD